MSNNKMLITITRYIEKVMGYDGKQNCFRDDICSLMTLSFYILDIFFLLKYLATHHFPQRSELKQLMMARK